MHICIWTEICTSSYIYIYADFEYSSSIKWTQNKFIREINLNHVLSLLLQDDLVFTSWENECLFTFVCHSPLLSRGAGASISIGLPTGAIAGMSLGWTVVLDCTGMSLVWTMVLDCTGVGTKSSTWNQRNHSKKIF